LEQLKANQIIIAVIKSSAKNLLDTINRKQLFFRILQHICSHKHEFKKA